MKAFFVCLFILASLPCFGANVLIYDTFTGQAKAYLRSVNTPDYSSRADVLVNPKIPSGVPLKFLKVENGVVVEMSQDEKDVIAKAELDAQKQAMVSNVNNLDVSVKDVVRALVKVINKRIPSDPITEQELIDQIKADKGL